MQTDSAKAQIDSSPDLDPVDYAVISQALIAIAREMGTKLIRSAYSTIIREASDASAALLDAEGNVVAQAELIPMQLGPMRNTFLACADRYPVSMLREGDFYINNDPFAGGQHLPDVFIYSPIFFDGAIVAFAGTVAHHLDLGGGSPGLSTDAADIHGEGLVIPPSLYNFERDWNGGMFERLVTANIRVPVQTIGDFNAQFAANAIGAYRVTELCHKYGAAKLRKAMVELMNYSERRCRNALKTIPDGVYCGEAAVDDDGISDAPLSIKAQVTVKGDSISVDFTGTSNQVGRNLNCPFSSTVSAALTAIKSALTSHEIPFNEGVKRPISISAPLGSLVNPKYPAPVRARMEAAFRCFNAVMQALSQVVPRQVIAEGNDATTILSLSHLSEGRYRIYLEAFGGGNGASHRSDGCDAVDGPLSNCSNTPIEAADHDFEYFRIDGYGLIPDSGGAGKYRGGLGFFRRYRILKDGVHFSIYSDRFRIAPSGLFGGLSGITSRCEVQRQGSAISIRSKDRLELRTGDILTLYTGGGAGYGRPEERSSELIERDITDGYTSHHFASVFAPRSPEEPQLN